MCLTICHPKPSVMKTSGKVPAGRYAGVLSKEHIRMLIWVERSGMSTRDEALAGSALATEPTLATIRQLEKHYLLIDTGGLLRITQEGSDFLTSLGLGAKSFRSYIPRNALTPPEYRALESMALLYRKHYHAAWLHTLQCLKYWSWIRQPGSRRNRRKRKPADQYIAILLHDLLFHPLPPTFQPGFPSLDQAPSFMQIYSIARELHPTPRYSLPEFLHLKDFFFRHERYSMMYLLEARHYRSPHFRLNMRNIYRYFLHETRPHRKTVTPATPPSPPPPGTRRLPIIPETLWRKTCAKYRKITGRFRYPARRSIFC